MLLESSLPIQKRVVWLVRRRWHSKVEVGFVDQIVESDTKLVEQLEVVAKDIPNLVDVEMEVGFHDHLVGSDMEIVEHLVMDDPVAVGGYLYVAKHLFVSNGITSIVSLACVDGDLHIVSSMEFFVAYVDSLVVDVDEDLLMKHYVQSILGCEHADWVVDMYLILMFQLMENGWFILFYFY